jgi:hypothetical protein
MTDQSENKSGNTGLYVLSVISILIFLMWFLAEVHELRSHRDQRTLLPKVEVPSKLGNKRD